MGLTSGTKAIIDFKVELLKKNKCEYCIDYNVYHVFAIATITAIYKRSYKIPMYTHGETEITYIDNYETIRFNIDITDDHLTLGDDPLGADIFYLADPECFEKFEKNLKNCLSSNLPIGG